MLTDQELTILTLRSQGKRQTEIARLLNTTQGAVSRSEAAARKKLAKTLKDLEILKELGVHIEEKFYGVDEKAAAIKKLIGGLR